VKNLGNIQDVLDTTTKKYVDDGLTTKADLSSNYITTLDTTWSGTVAPFTKLQTVSGILETDTPIIDLMLTGAYATDKTICDEWGKVYRAVTSANTVTFYAHEIPTVNLPLQIKVVR